jgi:O-acetylhomoserine/O-acetylserine sulfhydrylase-like pyridoxal-dependent enzyme
MQKQVSYIAADQNWLRNYYAVRFAVSAAWVVTAFTLGNKGSPQVAVAMLIAYPLWDALANLADARSMVGWPATVRRRSTSE